MFPNIDSPEVSNNIPGNPCSCFLISCFVVSRTPSIMVLIISSISSFEMTSVIYFSALTTPGPCIFLWIVPTIADADPIVAHGAKNI